MKLSFRLIGIAVVLTMAFGCDDAPDPSGTGGMAIGGSAGGGTDGGNSGDGGASGGFEMGGQPDPGGDSGPGGAGGEPGPGVGGASETFCNTPTPAPTCDSDAFAECTPREGSNGASLLVGTVLTPGDPLCQGEVLVDRADGRILCVAESCRDHEAAADASVICADVVLPGIIDPHNHLSFNTLPPWRHEGRQFSNRDQWRGLVGRDLYDARPSGGDPVSARYNELRLLLAGTTAVHKAEGSMASWDHARNLDRGPDANGLGYSDYDITECVFPLNDNCGIAPNYVTDDFVPERAYLAHVAEGIDSRSRAEFHTFDDAHQLGEKTAVIHCVACGSREFSIMRARKGQLVWSPQSNIDLYGATTDVSTAMAMDINVALGPDWTPSGSLNQLGEMKCAQHVSQTFLGGGLNDRTIVDMVTTNAAKAMGVSDLIGQLETGHVADVLAINGDRTDPYAAVVAADASAIRAVFIGGALYYGDSSVFDAQIARNAFCEDLDLCGSTKRICVRDEDGEADPSRRDDYPRFSLQDHITYLTQVIDGKRPANLPEDLAYAFTLAPLFECASQPSCDLGNSRNAADLTADDVDGDASPNDVDNCPDLFNPEQSDTDGDGTGDACDRCPWGVDDCPCRAPTADDLDGDGLSAADDNCPTLGNPDQADTDGDGRGDACDACPEVENDRAGGCPVHIQQLKRGILAEQQRFTVSGVVSAVVPEGAPASQVGSIFIQVPSTADHYTGPEYTGIYVYLGNRQQGVPIPSVGDDITLTGYFSIYYGQAQINGVNQLVINEASDAPAPVELSVADLVAQAVAFEAVAVCVDDVGVTDIAPPAGPGDSRDSSYEFMVGEVGGAQVLVNDLLHRMEPFPAEGDRFERICGILRYANEGFKIEPRGPADLALAPPEVATLLPARTRIRAGHRSVPIDIDGTPLTIALGGAAPFGGQVVDVTSDTPDALSPIGPVLVPAGQRSLALTLEALEAAEGVSISASAPGQGDEITAIVDVLAPDAPIDFLRVNPNSFDIRPDTMMEVTLEFGLPTPPGTLLNIAFEPPGLVSVANDELMIPEGVASHALQLTTGALEGETSLVVTGAGLRAEARINVAERVEPPIINEVNADMAGDETLEFVEIYNPGFGPYPLADLRIELVNGSNGMSYEIYPLAAAGEFIGPGQYLVLGDAAVADLVADGSIMLAIDSSGNQHDIQNGNPDGVRLYNGDEILDQMSYGGSVEGLTEGVDGAPDDPNTEAGETISRCPDGVDTNDNAADYRIAAQSPGGANACE